MNRYGDRIDTLGKKLDQAKSSINVSHGMAAVARGGKREVPNTVMVMQLLGAYKDGELYL